MSIWEQMVHAFGEGTATALAGLEIVSLLLVIATAVCYVFDRRRQRRQRVIDEREEMVAQARRARGLS